MTTTVEERARDVLNAWTLDLVSSADVEAWLQSRLLEEDRPGTWPDWLLTLASSGPDKCAEMSSSEFPFEWPRWAFRVEFAAELVALDLESRPAVLRFVRWLISAAMGEDLDLPEVKLGYQLDHLVCDCDLVEEAITEAQRELPQFVPSARAIIAPLLECIQPPLEVRRPW